MKRLIVAILVLATCGVLFAQASPFSFYGSARTGFFYRMDETYGWVTPDGDGDEKWESESRLFFHDKQLLQGNSRIGIDYSKDNLSGKAEFGYNGGDVEMRKFYGKYDFDGWTLLAGKDVDGTDMLSNQAYDNDLGLNGYGAVFGGRNPQIRFGFFEDALYFSIIKGKYMTYEYDRNGNIVIDEGKDEPELKEANDRFDTIIPKINLGYKWDINDDMTLHPTAMIQMFNYNKDYSGFDADKGDQDATPPVPPDPNKPKINGIDESIMSYLIAITFDWKINDEMKLRVHGNYGQNIANMGFGSEQFGVYHTFTVDTDTLGTPIPNADGSLTPKVEDTYNINSMGGYLTFGYNLSDQFGLGLGVGYATTTVDGMKYYDKDGKEVDWSDDRMAFYLQAPYKCLGALTITPEVGMHMEMNNAQGNSEGSTMYFGAQLRYDF